MIYYDIWDVFVTYGVFLSHRGTPSHHPFLVGFSMKSTTNFGYPHDYGHPHLTIKKGGTLMIKMSLDQLKIP